MPTSTAATTILASSPGLRPPSLTGIFSVGSRTHQGRRRQVDRERAGLLVDAEPFQANRPSGHPQGGGIERTAQRRHHIGAGAPVLADGNFDLRGAFLDVDGLRGQQPVAQHVDGQPAGRARIDRHHHGVAGQIFRLVDRGFQQVRRIGAAVGIPADIELHRGQRTIGLGRFDVEPVAAGLRRQRDPGRLVGGDREIAIGNPLGRFDRLIFPGRVLPVPLIAGFDLQQLVAQAVPRQLLALGGRRTRRRNRPCRLPRRSCRRTAV